MIRPRFEYVLDLRGDGLVTAVPRQGARNPTPEDADLLARLMLDAYRGSIDDGGEGLDDARAEVSRYLAGEYGPPLLGESWLLERHPSAAYPACLWPRRGCPLISFVMTDPDAKRRGLASTLLGRSLAGLLAAGHVEVRAVITAGNEPSERLFAKHGFFAVMA